MITITNEKVAGFEPRWAPFRGSSLLFDNPGKSTTPMSDLHRLNCCVYTEPGLQLYKAFAESLEEIGRDLLINTYLFCPLPSYSYHVTVWDGVNDSNVNKVKIDQRTFKDFLDNLPDSFTVDTDFIGIIEQSPLVKPNDWSISLEFDSLSKWTNKVLVASLKPANNESEKFIEWIRQSRRDLSASFQESFGVNLSTDHPYAPHVSFGYFANEEHGELATSRLEHWDELFRQKAKGVTITFRSISLYAFTDMVTSFKRA